MKKLEFKAENFGDDFPYLVDTYDAAVMAQDLFDKWYEENVKSLEEDPASLLPYGFDW